MFIWELDRVFSAACHLGQMGGKIQIFTISSWKCKIDKYTFLNLWHLYVHLKKFKIDDRFQKWHWQILVNPLSHCYDHKFMYFVWIIHTYWHYQIIIIVSQAWPHFTSLLTAENLYFAIKMKLEIFIFVNLVSLFSSVYGNTRDVDGVCVALHCGLQSTACALDGDCSKVSLFCFVFEDYLLYILFFIYSPIIYF